MAQWGVAMSHYHGLWDNGDTPAGRLAVKKAAELAASNARRRPARNHILKRWLRFMRKMARMPPHTPGHSKKNGRSAGRLPGDNEAAIFHALTPLHHRAQTDKTFANQRRCGEILEPIFQKLPHHPGVAHYIIHCYDNPVLAERGLPAARMYANIAPASAHANQCLRISSSGLGRGMNPSVRT